MFLHFSLKIVAKSIVTQKIHFLKTNNYKALDIIFTESLNKTLFYITMIMVK